MNERWVPTTLKEICVIDWGNTSLTKAYYVPDGEFLAVSAAGCDGRIGHAEHRKNTPVLSAIGAQCGRMFYPQEDFTAIKNTITLTPRPERCTGKFLYYLLTFIELPQRGAGQPFISKGDIQAFPVQIPSLSHQKFVVTSLEEAFKTIDTAVMNARANVANARELFQCYIRSVFANKLQGWIEKALGQVCEMYQPKTISTKDLVPNGPFPVFGANGIIGRYSKFNHEEPQLLITCRGATCGSVNVSFPKSWITGNAMVVRPRDRTLDLKFLEFAFRGGIDISPAITGSAQPQITRTNLSPLMVRYPNCLSEQKRLASHLERLAENVEQLEACYERRLELLAELKQAVLRKAVAGEPTTRSAKAAQEAAE